jgi:(p)ppGpp synthase/HD superfamily hydrolase
MSIVESAKELATIAHQDQYRKYTGEPYINHLREVVTILRNNVDTTDEMLAAAWLHDAVEDQNVPYNDIIAATNETTASYVWYLTKPPLFVGNRARRKHMDRVRLGNAPSAVQTIKYADLLSNTKDLVQYDPQFAGVFISEGRELVRCMTQGDERLRFQITDRFNIMEAQLNYYYGG